MHERSISNNDRNSARARRPARLAPCPRRRSSDLAGRFAFKEGGDDLIAWVKREERRLYRGGTGNAILALNELDVSPSNETRLEPIRSYLRKRIALMNYDELRKEDLDVASRAVEGTDPKSNRPNSRPS